MIRRAWEVRPLGLEGGKKGQKGTANAAMSRYACGDDGAFAAVYPVLAPALRRYLVHQTRDPERAEDLLQQTLLQIHCSRTRFELGADVFPWAFSIARRFLIDGIRRYKREATCARDLAAIPPPVADMCDDLVHSMRVVQTLKRELHRLPDTQRVAFELVKNEGLSVRQAAELLGTTVVAIKLRTHRASIALRDAIGD